MDIYSLLVWDAFNGMFMFSLSSETAWFAAQEFGIYNLFNITAVCYVGGVLGAIATTCVGYGFSRIRKNVLELDEELYEKLSKNFAQYGIYIFLFQMIPFVKVLFLFAGMLNVPFRRLVLITMAGRVLYYLYYLYVPPIF